MTRSALACLATAVALLAGCGGGNKDPEAGADADGGQPVEWPPASVLAVPHPVGPEPRSPDTRAKAREYVEYVVAQVNYTLQTTYVDRVLRNSRCQVCTDVVESADRAMADRQLFETEGWKTELVRLSRPQPEFPGGPWHYWAFDLKVHAAPVDLVDEDGRHHGRIDGRTLSTVMVVGHASRWQLARWFILTAVPDPQTST